MLYALWDCGRSRINVVEAIVTWTALVNGVHAESKSPSSLLIAITVRSFKLTYQTKETHNPLSHKATTSPTGTLSLIHSVLVLRASILERKKTFHPTFFMRSGS